MQQIKKNIQEEKRSKEKQMNRRMYETPIERGLRLIRENSVYGRTSMK